MVKRSARRDDGSSILGRCEPQPTIGQHIKSDLLLSHWPNIMAFHREHGIANGDIETLLAMSRICTHLIGPSSADIISPRKHPHPKNAWLSTFSLRSDARDKITMLFTHDADREIVLQQFTPASYVSGVSGAISAPSPHTRKASGCGCARHKSKTPVLGAADLDRL